LLSFNFFSTVHSVPHLPPSPFVSKITGLTTCNNIWTSPRPGSCQILLSQTLCSFIPPKSLFSQFQKALAKVANQYSIFSFHGLSANFSTSNQALLEVLSSLGLDDLLLSRFPLLPLPPLCAHVLMRITHWLSVPVFMGSSASFSTQRAQKQTRNLIYSHEKNTASLHRQKSFCTLDLQPKIKVHQIHANGARRLETGFKTTGRNVMFKEERVSPA